MWNKPGREQLSQIPALYSTEGVALEDKVIYLYFFLGNCDWYVAEFDGEDIFFGYANLGDPRNAEWGYFSFRKLQEVNVHGFEIDCGFHWQPKKFSEIIEERR